MSKVINIVGYSSNVGKTFLMESLIKELKNRGYSIATIKHDVHGFDIDKKGKDTYKHREAGSETVVISSKNRFAMIKELHEEIELSDIIKMLMDKDIILVEGILILEDPRIRELLDIKVYVDTDADIRIIRRIQRDVIERARSLESVISQYMNTVKPMHEEFVEPSKKNADIIVLEGGMNLVAMDMIKNRIRQHLSTQTQV